MAASRAAKLIFGAILVCSFILTAGYTLAVTQDQSGESSETLTPTPAAENNEHLATVDEDSGVVAQQCDEAGCTFEGVPLCSPPGRLWVRADWLMWWTSGANLPPLVTNSPSPTTLPSGQAGALGQPGTTIVFGNSTVYDGGRSGVRLSIGGWLDNCHRWGLEADWLTLAGKSINFSQSSMGNPIVSRPFFNVQTNAEDSQPVAYPGLVTGTVSVTGNDFFESVGMDLRYNLSCNSCGDLCEESCDGECGLAGCDPCRLYYCRTDLLVGYRHYLLGDNLAINEDLLFVNTRNLITDSFSTRNEFHGTEIGLNTQLRRGRWSLDFLAKMAMGNSHETVRISGSTTFIQPQSVLQYPTTGIYATSASGTNGNPPVHTLDQFVVIPNFGVEMGYQINCRWRAFVGYNVLYWAPVMRAGDQIDRNIDPRNWAPPVEGALHFPAYLARQTNFWAQGINVGTEFRF